MSCSDEAKQGGGHGHGHGHGHGGHDHDHGPVKNKIHTHTNTNTCYCLQQHLDIYFPTHANKHLDILIQCMHVLYNAHTNTHQVFPQTT